MTNLPSSTARRKSELAVSSITARSTGTNPDGWRAWWREESIRVGSDWKSLLDSLEVALRWARQQHLGGQSS
jgi:hypothetical protein